MFQCRQYTLTVHHRHVYTITGRVSISPMMVVRCSCLLRSLRTPQLNRNRTLFTQNNSKAKGVLGAYNELISNGAIQRDDHQREIAVMLQDLSAEVTSYENNTSKASFFSGWFANSNTSNKPKGKYLYGSVGCGKTMLMDLLYENVNIARKKRVHFNAFMLDVHKRIHKFKASQPKADHRNKNEKPLDPIQPVAKQIRTETSLLCFDEFQVTDVADALILKRLFTCLFDSGIIVVATSNRHPQDLYKNGLQRPDFLPFIPILQSNCDIVHLASGIDYRWLNVTKVGGATILMTDSNTQKQINELFTVFCEKEIQDGHSVEERDLFVFGRKLKVEECCGGVAKFTFDQLCLQPLGPVDYLAIGEAFDTVFIENIPTMSVRKKVEMRRFISLIDNFYDKKVRIVCSVAKSWTEMFVIENPSSAITDEKRALMDDLGMKLGDANAKSSIFTGEEEVFALDRTLSRINEMQTHQYWQQRGK